MTTPQRPIYLDYAATTPLDPRVLEKMLPYLTDKFGNPASSSHAYGWEAEEAVEEARAHIAALINADPKEIIFTSGATESDNLAIKGAAQFYKTKGKHLITVKTEHKAVLDTMREMERQGFEVTYLGVKENGLIDLDELKAAIRPDTILVSVMWVNNEIGVIQDIPTIGKICREHKIVFHVDAAQACGKTPVDVEAGNIDLLSMSAHFRLAKQELDQDIAHALKLRQIFLDGIAGIEEVYINGDLEHRVATNLNVSFNFVEGESLIMAVKEIAVSSGSACTSASLEPSYVLRALGRNDELAHSSLRITFGRMTSEEDIKFAAELIKSKIGKLRELSPLWEMFKEGVDLNTVEWAAH